MSPRLQQFAAPVTAFAQRGVAHQQVVLLLCCIMHAIHDGYTSAMYLLLPLIATDLQLSYAQVGFLKTLISGGQSLFQLPGGIIAERVGERRMLALGLATLSGAFLLLSPAWSFPMVATLCLLIGVGASLQHPLSSSLVSRAYEAQGRRTAMGTYNFAGDVGKVAFPALLSGMILVLSWRGSVELLGVFGLVAALVVWMGGKGRERVAHPTADAGMQVQKPRGWGITDRKRFGGLVTVGMLDESARAAFLTFVPFLLAQKGANPEQMGLLFTLVFAGGACGKFVCGPLAERLGAVRMVVVTELLTGLSILALLPLPLTASLVLLPVLGVFLNGTSSVLYATVAELVAPEARTRGYGLFYMLYQGSGMIAPVLYGWLGDVAGLGWTMILLGFLTMGAAPLAVLMRERKTAVAVS
jgi:FSR family fosmidomycin resistance protein-like MFS transporter